MIDPLAINLTMDYICENDKKSDNPTIWIIGALDSFTQSRILRSNIMVTLDEKGNPVVERDSNKDTIDFAVIKYGLKGFKNFGNVEFKTEKIKMLEQEYEVVSDEILKRIPILIIHELADIIWKGNIVSEELKKN